MKWTKRKALIGGLVLALIAAAIVLKLAFFPSIRDAYFAMDARSLRQAPTGLVVVRPTHFPYLHGEGILYAAPPRRADRGQWMMGRDAPLRTVIAAAYGENPSHVVMPADAPAGNFGFLVTTADKQREHLQSAIRRTFGCVAQKETRDTAVLALKVTNVRLPGLTVSNAHEKPNIDFMGYEIRFTHLPVAVLANGLDQYLSKPLVDETGLTNFYDFSIPWNSRTRRLQGGEMDPATVTQMLADLGLGLKPDTAKLEMLVVRKAN